MKKEKTRNIELLNRHITQGLEILNHPSTNDIYKAALSEYKHWTEPQKSSILEQYQLFRNDLRKERETPIARVVDVNKLDNKISGVVFLPTMGDKNSLKNFSSVVSSITEAFKGGFSMMFGIIVDKSDRYTGVFLDNISRMLFKEDVPFFILSNPVNIGYVASIKIAMKFFKRNQGNSSKDIFAGFVDDDALLTHRDHYLKLEKMLNENSNLFALSGLAVDYDNGGGNLLHNFFNIPNSFNIVDRAKKKGFSLSRPHIHGGGGGCLMRLNDLEECIEVAEANKIMLGPAISAVSGLLSKKSLASDDLPVIHKTKETFYLWLLMVLKYYRTWKAVEKYYGNNSTTYKEDFQPRADGIFKNILEPRTYEQYLMLKKFREHFKKLLW